MQLHILNFNSHNGQALIVVAVSDNPGYTMIYLYIQYLSIFFQLTQYDNTSTLILPHHPPEVLHCVLQWSLSGYIGTLLLVTLHSVNIVRHRIRSHMYKFPLPRLV